MGGSGFGEGNPPLDPPASVLRGRDSQPTNWSLRWKGLWVGVWWFYQFVRL